jgi:hypothetical protein
MAAAYRPRPVFQLKRDPDHPKASKLGGSNCNPSAAAILIDFATCGHRRTTGAAVRDLTDDFDGGMWLGDVAKAVRRGFRVDMDLNTGRFERVLRALEAGRGVSLCGSSIVTLHTKFQASETFDGNHQVALTDIRKLPDGTREILVFDPLADGRRAAIARAPMWMPVDLVREFAGRLDLRSEQERAAGRPREPLGIGRATYAVTEAPRCPAEPDDGPAADQPGPAKEPPPVRLRLGAKRAGGPDGRELAVAVPVGRVRERPRTTSEIVGRKREGESFLAFQRIRGQRVAGSRLWFGDRHGSRWMHSSLFELGEAGEIDEPGEDPGSAGLPPGNESQDASDLVVEGLEDVIGEDLWD